MVRMTETVSTLCTLKARYTLQTTVLYLLRDFPRAL